MIHSTACFSVWMFNGVSQSWWQWWVTSQHCLAGFWNQTNTNISWNLFALCKHNWHHIYLKWFILKNIPNKNEILCVNLRRYSVYTINCIYLTVLTRELFSSFANIKQFLVVYLGCLWPDVKGSDINHSNRWEITIQCVNDPLIMEY